MTAAGKAEKREPYLDCLRGTGIVFVVLGHLNPGLVPETWIYSFHMFLFFFLSGFLFHRKMNFGQQTAAAAKSCLIPYFFWSFCAVLFSLAIGEYDCLTALCRLFYIGGSVSWNSPVWFLVVLFWLKLLGQAAGEHPVVQTGLLAAGLFLGYTDFLGGLAFGLPILPTAAVFFFMGRLMRRGSKLQAFWAAAPFWTKIIGVLALLGVGFWVGLWNGRISVYGVFYGYYPFALVSGVSGVLGLWLLHKLAYDLGIRNHGLEYWGRYTLNVMATHYFILRGLSGWSQRCMGGSDLWHSEGFEKAALCTAAVFVAEYLTIEALKRLNCPRTHIFLL